MDSTQALILLVDDDPDFIEINRAILEARGYRVACAARPADALRKMEAEPPDLVVTDLMMGRLDSGFSLAQEIKRHPRFGATPVILVTAVGSQFSLDFRPRTPEDLAAMHADAYLDKPVVPETLLAKVQELLERAREGDEGRGTRDEGRSQEEQPSGLVPPAFGRSPERGEG